MKPLARSAGIATLSSCFLLGCAATDQRFGDAQWYQKTRATEQKVVTLAKSSASASYTRMQKYLGEKDLLKTFHDTGEHSEAAVLDVLHRAGLGKPGSAAQAGSAAPPSGASKPVSPPLNASSATKPKGPSAPATAQSAGPRPPNGVPAAAHVPERYAGEYGWPVDAGIISSEFGERWGKPHKGLDIAADMGEEVHAVAPGEVIYAGDGLRGYGNVVIVKHDQKITSLYAHNSALKVKLGDQVKRGDLVALLGSTGHSTGPHVHFEFRNGDVALNPHTLLPKSMIGEAAPPRAAEVDPSRDPARVVAQR